jgi:hypothetical protein
MDAVSAKHTLKDGCVKPPDQHPGAEICQLKIKNSHDSTKTRWGMSSDICVKRAVANAEREVEQIGKALPTRTTTPLSQGHRF